MKIGRYLLVFDHRSSASLDTVCKCYGNVLKSNVLLGQLLVIIIASSEIRQELFSDTGTCSTDAPYTVKKLNRIMCASECLHLATCEDFNHYNDIKECALFLHKPLFYDFIPQCAGFKASQLITLLGADCDSATDALIISFFTALCLCSRSKVGDELLINMQT